MSDTMQFFIASAIRSLTTELKRAKGSAVPISPEAAAESAQMGAKDPAPVMKSVLDVSGAEKLRTGSFIFLKDLDRAVDWYVLIMLPTHEPDCDGMLSFRGCLKQELDAETFCASAFEYILMRPIDTAGQEVYPALLKNNELTDRDVLKILAESDEAKNLGHALVIAPDTSHWLTKFGINTSNGGESPLLFARL